MERFDIICEGSGERLILGRPYETERKVSRRIIPRGLYVRAVDTHWAALPPVEILKTLGVDVEPRRAREFCDLIDGDAAGFDYLGAAATYGNGEEVLKWTMGGLAAALNERGLAFTQASQVLPADYLGAFVHALVNGGFEKSFAKDIFAALLTVPRHRQVFGTEWITEDPDICGGRATYRGSRLEVADFSARIAADHDLDEILEDWGYVLTVDKLSHGEAYLVARDEMGWWHTEWIDGRTAVHRLSEDPRFKAADTSEIDALLDEVIAANPDNAAKVKDQPKLVQWFVGQAMKAVKAKGLPPMPPPVVLEKLKAKFGVE
jgi:uncharacterized protein (DUF433 family)